jgi:hypothetical protein
VKALNTTASPTTIAPPPHPRLKPPTVNTKSVLDLMDSAFTSLEKTAVSTSGNLASKCAGLETQVHGLGLELEGVKRDFEVFKGRVGRVFAGLGVGDSGDLEGFVEGLLGSVEAWENDKH